MKLRSMLVTVAGLAAACGGKSKPAEVKKPVVVEAPKPPPPPPPVCVPATEPALIARATSNGTDAQFCASDGGEASSCFSVGLTDGKYAALAEAPAPQSPSLAAGKAYLQTTPTEVKVCVTADSGDASCTTLKPKVGRGASEPILAVTNDAGTTGVAMLGDAAAGRVSAVTAAGDLLAVHLRGERGDRVVIVDPRTGGVVGTFTVGDAP